MKTQREVTGSVQKKNNKWYIVINLYDSKGQRKLKWINTKLDIRGNKKKAEIILEEELCKYNAFKQTNIEFLHEKSILLFGDYMYGWLECQKKRVDDITYASDELTVRVHLYPYFKNVNIDEINSEIINKYFEDKRNGYGNRKKLSGTSLQRHYATISSILSKAVKEGYIQRKDVEDIVKPKCDTQKAQWYNSDQTQKLIDILKLEESKLLIPVILASYYGLRREEVVGIKECDVDFNNHLLNIQHSVVTGFVLDNNEKRYKTTHLKKDSLKTKSSVRSFPLFPDLEKYLKKAIEKKKNYMTLYGDAYNMNNIDYILVHENGNLITPDYITHTFRKVIKKYNLLPITFHGLRHSCASLLLNLGYSMKEIQEWLGHSSYNTTAKTYVHVDQNSKKNIVDDLSKKVTI